MINRMEQLQKAREDAEPFDVIVIGGGATGLGCAFDASSRGYRTLLLEQSDFAKGTSSRSTKLIHGGVRYLKQGQVSLVFHALRERKRLLKNAPHLVSTRSFIIPSTRWWEKFYYGLGLKLYDLMGHSDDFARSEWLSTTCVRNALPTLQANPLYGGNRYYDGQFDDARLAINLMQSIYEQGGIALNYAKVTSFIKENGRIQGVYALDCESGETFPIHAGVVINATGVFTDRIRQMDDPGHKPVIRPSQGVHIVLERSFFPGDSALLVPKTADGRVLFAIPWYNRVLIGTTDSPVETPVLEPTALEEEIEFLLDHAGRYLTRAPSRSDIKSIFTGLRPLVSRGKSKKTQHISRNHTLLTDPSGLITITGGKWTTYRKMAEETIDRAIRVGKLPPQKCKTADLPIHGWCHSPADDPHYRFYGSDEKFVRALAGSRQGWTEPLHPHLTCRPCDVAWAARNEMARTVDDVLSRRSRSLLLDVNAALNITPIVATILAEELGHGRSWIQQQIEEFQEIAGHYQPNRNEKR
ncbi:MAG: FAD-dependent oxidoreductase [Balneolaceae bacterium]